MTIDFSKLETPCIVIDVDKAKKNIFAMQSAVAANGCKLRPHIKTHKMPLFAKMQLEAGAIGISCAKITEAEIMANAGIDDIFIAYPLIGEFRLFRALELQKKTRRLILAVDSADGAFAMSRFAVEHGTIFEVRLEIDTGAARTGICSESAVELAALINSMEGLKLTGIYTFKSLVYHGQPTKDNESAANEEAKLMSDTAEAIRSAGIPICDISAGSSPTGIQVAASGLVTEVRPGTYIFNDYMTVMEKCAKFSDIAVRIYATVVSTPRNDYAVIDGGTKTFPMDILLDSEPYRYPGYAIVMNNDGSVNNNLQLRRMNEEHGMISAINGQTGLHVGDILELVPIHVCTAINMQNNVWLSENGELCLHKVDARGMLI